MFRGVFFVVFAVALMSSCSRSTPARVSEPTDEGSDLRIDPREEEEAKRRLSDGVDEGSPNTTAPRPPKLVDLQASLEAASEHPRIALRMLPNALASAIEETPLPVLIPSERALQNDEAYEGANFIGAERWYSVSFSFDDGLSLELRGVSAARDHQGYEPPESAALEGPTLSRTHGIVDLTFSRFGIGYALQIECAEPLSDPRCAKEDFVQGVFESLLLVERAP